MVAAGVTAVLFVLGSWNPWRLVVLEYRFGNPTLGALVVPPVALVGAWLGLPVVNEARQAGRLAWRVALAVMVLLGVSCWGLFGAHFRFTVDEVVRSDHGELVLALVSDSGRSPDTYLRVWSGTGIGAREVAELGEVCGPVSVRFLGAGRVEVQSTYGDWQLDLDPETGAPRQVLGPGCGDGPVPVGG